MEIDEKREIFNLSDHSLIEIQIIIKSELKIKDYRGNHIIYLSKKEDHLLKYMLEVKIKSKENINNTRIHNKIKIRYINKI